MCEHIFMTASSEILFGRDSNVAPIGIIAMNSVTELGGKIDDYLVDWAGKGGINVDTFLVESECPRFSSGDGKGLIKSTVRGKDLFIIIDVGNYSIKYDYFGMQNSMSPDDHFQDLKRIIQAASGKAHRITVIMPTLYGGRQHRRSYRESLDCACALQELEAMGVSNIVTFDAHDPRVQNAVPLMGFDNVMPTYQVLKAMLKDIKDINLSKEKFMVVSPDEGALNRNMYYASVLGVDMGMFYKRRDYSTIVNGRNPIVAHEYLGNPVEGKDVFVADDIISSGESMLDLAYNLKKKKAGSSHTLPTLSSQMVLKSSTRLMKKVLSAVYSAQTSHTDHLSFSADHGSTRLMYQSTSHTSLKLSTTMFPSARSLILMKRSRTCSRNTA